MLDEKKEREFQISLLKLQTKLEFFLATYIGLVAISYGLYTHFGTIKSMTLQLIMIGVISFLMFALVWGYKYLRNKGFKELENKYLKD